MKGSDLINTILPDELMIEIFRRLNSKADREASSSVCKRWLSLVGQSVESIYIDQPESFASDSDIKLRCRRFVNVRRISIDEGYHCHNASPSEQNAMRKNCLSDSVLDAIGDGFIKLESLGLYICLYVTCAGLISIAKKCKWLKSLTLQECYIGDEGGAAIGKYCTRLEKLSLNGCNSLTDKGLIQLALGCGRTLKSLGLYSCRSLTDSSLEVVGLHCVFLESLSLQSEFINDEGLLLIAKGCPLLKSLELLRCINVTDKSLCAIGKGCKKLNNLSLWGCDSLSELGLNSIVVGCPELGRLEIRKCNNIGAGVLISIRKASMHLSQLVVEFERFQQLETNVLGQIVVEWEYLQSLCLLGIGNDALRLLTTGCTNLKKLDIHGCSKVGNEGIISVAENCRFLTHLGLGFCSRVGDAGIIAIARYCPRLSYLNVNCVQKLGDEGLTALSEGCQLLKELKFWNCPRITDVGLCSIARNCTILERCEAISCPCITETGVRILIRGCQKLKSLYVSPHAISSRTRRRLPSHVELSTFDHQW